MNGYFRTPPVVANLLIINLLVFFAETLLPKGIAYQLIDGGALHFWGAGNFKFYQLVSYMFIHDPSSFWHVLSNMFALWMFGRTVEYDLGSKRFFAYYMICGIGAGLIQLGVNWIEYSMADPGSLYAMQLADASTIGASGAVFGILLAFGMMRPNATIMLLFPPIPLKAKWFVIFYGLFELFAGVAGTGGGVAHFAHLGGMLWGFLLLIYWKRKGQIYY